MNPDVNDPFPVCANVRVYESMPRPEPSGQINAVLETHVRINPSLLHRYCFASPKKAAVDFLTVLGSIWFADRAVRRLRASGWGRRIHVVVPVLEVTRWSAGRRLQKLKECANYLTGDQWTFEFTRRRRMPPEPHTKPLIEVPAGTYVGVPYSDGIDSYAQARLLLKKEPKANLVCTFTAAKPGLETWDSLCKSRRRKAGTDFAIPVPVRIKGPRHPEITFRSRPLVFYGVAAYGAALAGSSRVMIPENGQGSLGGSLVLLGNEAPHRSCYPGFLQRLSTLLEDCLDKAISFEHPGLLKTKGQVMAELAEAEPGLEWTSKWSCSHDQRHSTLEGKRVHCGVCGGCILRRASMRAAGVTDATQYLFHDLKAKSLEEALPTGGTTNAMKAMKDIAGNSVRDMQRLAALANGQHWHVQQAALDVAESRGISPAAALEGVTALLRKHQAEWNEFLDSCGARSWIQDLASA